jgi:hypothetical protein
MNHPPRWLEGLVRVLLPAETCEHVLGDLSERYRSQGRYVADALQVLPGVIASQVRRKLAWLRLLILAPLLFAVLGDHAQTPLAAVLPTLLALAALALRDAYRLLPTAVVRAFPPMRQVLLDVAAVSVAVLLSQALVAAGAPGWLLPASTLRIGLPACCGLLFMLSLLPDPRATWPPLPAGPLSTAELRREARGFEAVNHREIRVEQGAALLAAASMLASLVLMLVMAPKTASVGTVITLTGAALGAAGGLLAAALLQRQARQTLPLSDGLAFWEVLAVYRRSLEQRRRATTHRWLYQLLTLVGPMIMISGVALHSGVSPWFVWVSEGFIAAMIALLVGVNRFVPRTLERRLDQLNNFSERS